MVRAMCGVQLKDRKRTTNLMGMKEIIDQLAMANSVCWYGHVLRRSQRGHGESRLRKKVKVWFEKERCTSPFKVECRKQDCYWVEVNLATLTYWGYHQILNIGVSLFCSCKIKCSSGFRSGQNTFFQVH